MFIGYSLQCFFLQFVDFWPEKEAICLGVPNVEAYGDVTDRFDIGNAQVNVFLFGP